MRGLQQQRLYVPTLFADPKTTAKPVHVKLMHEQTEGSGYGGLKTHGS